MDGQFVSRKKLKILLTAPAILVAMLIVGPLLEPRTAIAGAIVLIGAFGLNVLMFAWCRVDGEEQGFQLHRWFSYAFVLFGILAVVYYIFRSRGFVGGMVSAGWLLLYLFCTLVLAVVVAVVIIVPLVLSGFIRLEPLPSR